MPDTAKILPFRAREVVVPCTREEALARAKAFLATPGRERTPEGIDVELGDGDVLMSVCSLLWEAANTSPADVAGEAPTIYKWISARSEKCFFFDERDFFMGEVALLPGARSGFSVSASSRRAGWIGQMRVFGTRCPPWPIWLGFPTIAWPLGMTRTATKMCSNCCPLLR